MFPSARTMDKYVKKVRLFQVLQYLQKSNVEGSGSRVDWESNLFQGLGIEKYTAKKLVAEYGLKALAQNIIRVDQHDDWLDEWFGAHVIPLDKAWLESSVPTLLERARVDSKFGKIPRDKLWDDGKSGGKGQPLRTKPKVVQRRPIHITENADIPSFLAVENLKPILAESLGAELPTITMESFFVRTQEYAPQCPYVDFPSNVNGDLFLALAPLCELGCLLQVWFGHEPKVLHVPFGTMLLLPKGTVHSGGLHMDYQTFDLQLHLFIRVALTNPVQHLCDPMPLTDHPMDDDLHPGGLLFRALTADKLTYNESLDN